MQLANREVDKTLGLTRNVPILVGDITLYVQFHIVRNPACDVLLGQPFDILVESIVWNYSNEDQTITIHDPNSGRIATVICLGCNKDLCSRRSKYKSYGALRGCDLGGKGLSPGVLWQVGTVGSWQCDAMRNSAK